LWSNVFGEWELTDSSVSPLYASDTDFQGITDSKNGI
jgi:hypothetical protein